MAPTRCCGEANTPLIEFGWEFRVPSRASPGSTPCGAESRGYFRKGNQKQSTLSAPGRSQALRTSQDDCRGLGSRCIVLAPRGRGRKPGRGRREGEAEVSRRDLRPGEGDLLYFYVGTVLKWPKSWMRRARRGPPLSLRRRRGVVPSATLGPESGPIAAPVLCHRTCPNCAILQPV